MRKRLKQFIRKLFSPRAFARRPNIFTWREGAANCGVISSEGEIYRTVFHDGLWIAFQFAEAGDLFVANLMVINGSDGNILVNPILSSLTIWQGAAPEPTEKLRPNAARPSDMLEARRLTPKESLAGELYFRRNTFEAACFTILIQGVFYQFAISPAQESGGKRRKRPCLSETSPERSAVSAPA
jgi:hypothetical protein